MAILKTSYWDHFCDQFKMFKGQPASKYNFISKHFACGAKQLSLVETFRFDFVFEIRTAKVPNPAPNSNYKTATKLQKITIHAAKFALGSPPRRQFKFAIVGGPSTPRRRRGTTWNGSAALY